MHEIINKIWPPKIVVCQLDDETQRLIVETHENTKVLLERTKRTEMMVQGILALLHNVRLSDVIGGKISRLNLKEKQNMGTPGNNPFPPLTLGVTAKFQVTPSFSGAPFTLDGTKASVKSSDSTNFPVSLDPTDPTGTTIVAAIPTTASPVIGADGGEDITVDWNYDNPDGVVADVSGTVTEMGITDDVTGGTFARIA